MANIPLGGQINVGLNVASCDAKYGPYNSVQEAFNVLGPDGSDVLAVGLTVGIIQEDGSIKEYWFKKACDSVDDLVEKGGGGGDLSEYVRFSDTPTSNRNGVMTYFESLFIKNAEYFIKDLVTIYSIENEGTNLRSAGIYGVYTGSTPVTLEGILIKPSKTEQIFIGNKNPIKGWVGGDQPPKMYARRYSQYKWGDWQVMNEQNVAVYTLPVASEAAVLHEETTHAEGGTVKFRKDLGIPVYQIDGRPATQYTGWRAEPFLDSLNNSSAFISCDGELYKYNGESYDKISQKGEVTASDIASLDERTNIVGISAGRKAANHTYSFGCEVSQGKGVMFKIHYEHGDIPRSLQPRIVCFTKGDGETKWFQPFRHAYIDTSGQGNPTEFIPYRYGNRTPALSGGGDIYIYMAFADEAETNLEYNMEAYIHPEWNEALWDHDDARRTAPVSARFDINKQDIIFAEDSIYATGSDAQILSGIHGLPLRFYAKAGKILTSISFSTKDWKPIGELKHPETGEYTYTISRYTVPTNKGGYPLVEIEWMVDGANALSGSIDISSYATLSIPFTFAPDSGDVTLKRLTAMEEEVNKLKKILCIQL